MNFSSMFPRLVLVFGAILSAVPVATGASEGKLVVGTRILPPFVVRRADGGLEGISIELWRGIASDLGLVYEFRETDLPGLLDGLRSGSLDAGVAALTVTADREAFLDFTHPFYASGLGIAVPHEPAGTLAMLNAVFSWHFFKALGALVIVLMVVGIVIWLLERRANPKQFGGSIHEGVGSGFWWSAVTMTTVGYGDKAPVTALGRLVAIFWMFASIITISGFTAAIASVFTVQQLGSVIHGPQDLPGKTVGTVRESTSAVYLRDHRLKARTFDDVAQALEALADRQIDAVVYDAPILRYLSNAHLPGQVDVLPGSFTRQDYAFALKVSSPLREDINRALLRRLSTPEWEQVLYRYLGGR